MAAADFDKLPANFRDAGQTVGLKQDILLRYIMYIYIYILTITMMLIHRYVRWRTNLVAGYAMRACTQDKSISSYYHDALYQWCTANV